MLGRSCLRGKLTFPWLLVKSGIPEAMGILWTFTRVLALFAIAGSVLLSGIDDNIAVDRLVKISITP